MVALMFWSPPLPSPPQPRVPSPQRRRAATRQRGAAGFGRITCNTPFLARLRLPRSHPGHRRHAIGLIALCSSYDHLIFAGRNIPIPQQWGIPLIAASVAIVFSGCVQYGAPLGREAQLATRSRLRAAEDAARAADETTRERHLASEERQRAGQRENEADRERNRADQERNRAAVADERQRKSLERLNQTAVLSARVQLVPSDINRARLQTFLTLLNQTPDADSDL